MTTNAVINQLGNHDAAGDLRRGQFLADAAGSAVRGLPSVGRGVAHAANAVMGPVGLLGKPLLGAARGVGRFVSGSPLAQKLTIATMLGIPTLGNAAVSSMNKNVQNQLNASNAPERTVLAHHYIKTAGPGAKASLIGSVSEGFGKGLGGGVGTGIIDSLFSLGSTLGGRVLESTVTAPKREKIFYEAVKTDPVLRDALRSNPAVLSQMKEAFATLVRFAPSLSLDINAVRSYLREAVISGGGINYATIKQLADTEKVIHDRNTPRK